MLGEHLSVQSVTERNSDGVGSVGAPAVEVGLEVCSWVEAGALGGGGQAVERV